uniref:Uncharacterized protein n=1 Tax=Sphaerodactylus townsendi TaxID=933632 RepID=A0ACB8F5T3_9SAUR
MLSPEWFCPSSGLHCKNGKECPTPQFFKHPFKFCAEPKQRLDIGLVQICPTCRSVPPSQALPIIQVGYSALNSINLLFSLPACICKASSCDWQSTIHAW